MCANTCVFVYIVYIHTYTLVYINEYADSFFGVDLNPICCSGTYAAFLCILCGNK